MRKYTEIGLRPDNPPLMYEAAEKLGYSQVAFTGEKELKVISRVDLDPGNQNQLSKLLRNSRWNTEIITVNCRTKAVARQAGHDRRVDLITYPIAERWKRNYLDRQQAGLMRDSGAGYLIDVSHLLTSDRLKLRKNMEYLKRNLDNAVKHGLPVVISSFAAEPMGLRDPKGLASLLSLLDVDEDHALEMVSSIPDNMVKRNRAKLKDSYIQDGVWVI